MAARPRPHSSPTSSPSGTTSWPLSTIDSVGPSQTVLWGNSAGAITAVYLGYAMDDSGIDRPPVSAVISNAGGFIGENGSAEEFIEEGGGTTPDPSDTPTNCSPQMPFRTESPTASSGPSSHRV